MNTKRRAKLEKIKADLAELIEAEEAAIDNIPESLSGSERAQTAIEICDSLQQALDELESI